MSSVFDIEESLGTLTLYPNPTSDLTTISFPEGSESSLVTIQDVDGRIIYNSAIREQSEITVSTELWQSGLYIVKLELENGQFHHGKLIVK